MGFATGGHVGTRTGDGELVQRVPMNRRSL
jgi:hypothetical protein